MSSHVAWFFLCRYDASGPCSFYQKEGSAIFRARQWLGAVKFTIVCGIIRALGYPALAKKVWAGWQVISDSLTLSN